MTATFEFKAIQFYGPVTSLAFVRSNILLAGRGSNLSIYDWKLGEVLKEVKLFRRSKIQGIAEVVLGQSTIMVWGACSLGFINKNELLGEFNFSEYILQDWILAGDWDYHGNACVVTAHNLLLHISSDCKRVEKISTCGVGCILYSASIFSNEDDVIVAAGTVFGSIEIWSSKSQAVVSHLKGHEGSIFNLKFSKNGRRVVSCSDDRSIRIWDLYSSQCLAVGWGHSARIWQLIYLSNDTIISTGEDSTTRAWRFHDRTLNCVQVWEGHSGRSIWSLAVAEDDNTISTGGADGRIRLWNIANKPSIIEDRRTINFDDVARTITIKCGNIKQYTATRATAYAFSTMIGYIVLFDTVENSWKQIYYSPALAGYSIMKGWDDKPFFCVGDRQGFIYIIDSDDPSRCITIAPLSEICGKVIEIIPLSKDNLLYVLVQYGDGETPWSFFALKVDNGLSLEYSVALAAQPTFLIASACVHPNSDLIVVGSRFGALAVYSITATHAPIPASGCWRRVISEDCITSVTANYIDDGSIDILVTSRNGSYSVCNIVLSSETETATLDHLHLNRLAKGSIEGATYLQDGLVVWGFRNNYFFVWNETLQYEIMSEICGGPHRQWHFRISSPTEFSFVYTKASSISIVNVCDSGDPSAANSILQEGSHGREIRAISVAPLTNDRNALLVATGAEDTCIRLCNVFSDGRLRNLSVVRKHVSGIQELKWSTNGRYLFSSAAREEFISWKVTIRGKNVYLYPICSAPIERDLPDLRVMDFVVEDTMYNGARCYFVVTVYSDSAIKVWLFNPSKAEIRLLSIGRYKTCCIFKAECYSTDESFHLLIGSSDGHITSWDLSKLRQAALCSPACETAWKIQFPDPEWSLAVHQSSIKSLIIVKDTDALVHESFIIVSGGDDNCIAITKSTKSESNFLPSKEYTVADAHASTVTSLAQLTDDMVLSAAVDQHIRVWQLLPDSKLSLVEDTYTTVSDTGCVSTDSRVDSGGTTLLIGGAGLAIWHVNSL
ncbi:WD40-repeat-containing domain protein [Lipomyces tetrasporus]|uniref:WD40-repeat-containing domain protein n=1 Tax=Lipomyces tetrasporus TaxID=54092 RepID=A0AAD7QSW7_9ASCO|nr:WD40-repeat-containing domain protein [Lipomyces tetrasporus]KAJ8100386.1 WD40-repeat-containing domain protein [Lipomyces tetrasporus]